MDSQHTIRVKFDSIVNKSFLILDQIHESYFPLLEKSIYLAKSFEHADKAKLSKIEFVIEQRMKHVQENCKQLEAIYTKLPGGDQSKADLALRLEQLQCEQKRILSYFKSIQLKRVERERAQREQEELLTRRFTATSDTDDLLKKKCKESVSIDLGENLSKEKEKEMANNLKTLNKSTTVTMGKLRNQRPLVKRVRTRYLDFSTDFFGMTKVLFSKYSCIDCIILFGFTLVVLMIVFCIIVWQTSPRPLP